MRKKYNKTVLELNRLLGMVNNSTSTTTLANYQDNELSPLDSRDLLTIAESPERSPFLPFFQERIPELLERCSPKYVGISLNYLSQALTAFALIHGWF